MAKFTSKIGNAVWFDGKLIPAEKAQISVFTHSLHYGLGAFEGIRCYRAASGKLAVFRLEEHTNRLFDSCKIAEIKIPFSKKKINEAILEVIKNSGIKENVYIRPLVFIGEGPLGVFPTFDPPVRVAIMAWQWGAYLGEARDKGARVKISSFQRGFVNATMSKSKMTGNYTTGILAKLEVKRSGYDEALLLDVDGYVAEGSGENIFILKDGVIKTTPLTSVLNGITRNTVLEIASAMKVKVIEQRFTRDELYCADEAFFSGTAAEITPIREVDDRVLADGKPGAFTRALVKNYSDIVHGKNPKYKSWLTYL